MTTLTHAHDALAALANELALPPLSDAVLQSSYLPVAEHLHARAQTAHGCQIVGIAGAQGTGKSTWARVLQVLLETLFALPTAVLSLDDYYLPKAQRQQLAAQVHPLLATRGVPGTHDVSALAEDLRRIRAGEPIVVPCFSKAHDDRLLETRALPGGRAVLLFEGWCVGARPQPDAALRAPINDLERAEDVDGRFRGYVNERLRDDYAALWSQLDALVFLAAPSMESVLVFRGEQERKLAAGQSSAVGSAGVMDGVQLRRFVAHFERVTRGMLRDAGGYADVIVELDDLRGVGSVRTTQHP